MKRLLSVCTLSVALAVGNAAAAPPSPERVDALLQVLGTRQIVEQSLPRMLEQVRATYEAQLRARGSGEAEIARFQQVFDEQAKVMQQTLSWERLQPILLRAYSTAMQAEDIEAMSRFFASDAGRQISQALHSANTLEQLAQLQEGETGKAMRRFQETEEGRQVLQNLSGLMQVAATELDPLLQTAVAEMVQALEAEFGKAPR